MRWQGRRGSDNIEDRRTTGGGGPRMPRRARGIGIGGGRGRTASPRAMLVILGIVVVGWFFGVDLTPLLTGPDAGLTTTRSSTGPLSEADKRAGQFVSVTLADTEEVWAEIFREQVDGAYRPVTLVLFSGVTSSPCGNASGATGPFYCPNDQKAYLDTDFFRTLGQQLGAGGDFAQAYVVAHEVAHHVQDELGLLQEANARRARASTREANEISVRIELQADCYSGIWAKRAGEKFASIEAGDIEEALNAARKIGDDTLQKNAGRVPQPHTFTHGTAQQRSRWFATGYKTGDMRACDTFATDAL